ncbi:hypothetical protein P153DRAFT_20260 [Dothidotthia symphoricarpi CBS 119687]|uniref:C2H2-type domain-containing protein n=1 Tax=Dothidotthia symphoricarpi CBS 119687 TaxID=1392245 RepID=A0A6A6AEU2_9PLEO|nr:uncharacterized protein P153DRAFT_20260 [Dothidotthia symphoricarpi CBS 119687]KAF2129464.1 hypothetical protein P153DRAFT_20260 [Dothidotthia symphoricarpi CBS 119687]
MYLSSCCKISINRAPNDTEGAFFVRFKEHKSIELQGLVAILSSIPSRGHSSKSSSNFYPLAGLNFNNLSPLGMFLNSKCAYLANQWLTLEEAKKFTEDVGIYDNLGEVWRFREQPSENVVARYLNCEECGVLVMRCNQRVLGHALEMCPSAKSSLGSNSGCGLSQVHMYVGECTACLTLFHDYGRWLEHMKEH